MQSNKGVLVAHAIRELAPFIGNHVDRRPNSIKVEPPAEIVVPGLRTYTHVQVTGQIISRTIMPVVEDSESKAQTKKRPNSDLTSHLAGRISLLSQLATRASI